MSDDSYAELHEFAARLQLPRRSFDLDHYDVPEARFEDALALGARIVRARDVVRVLQDSGLRVRTIHRVTARVERRREYLSAEWNALGVRIEHHIGGAGMRAENWQRTGDDLLARWNEPHRQYHDERHLEDVLLALDYLALRGEEVTAETLAAAWFHDAVYQGRLGLDERESAELAARTLQQHGVESVFIQRVAHLVISTKPLLHEGNTPYGFSALHDADLAIFAAPGNRYREYAASVRAEYAHVPQDRFTAARAAILESYLNREAIYLSASAQTLWEERARENLGNEVSELRSAL